MPDDREAFLEERRLRLRSGAAVPDLAKKAADFFAGTVAAKYSYNFDWLGIPIIQYPQDIVAMQEIIWKVRPDLIIETGIARGGSVIFYASMMKLLGNGGRVVGIDVDVRPHNRSSIESHPLSECITLVEGSSIERKTVEKVAAYAKESTCTFVVLDSNHTYSHVMAELELYSPFVTAGSYIVVLDTVVEVLPVELIGSRPWKPGNSPMTAVQEFLEKSNRFEIDREIDAKLLISCAPSGYLRCVRK